MGIDDQPKSERKELLESVNFKYSGKEKIRKQGRRYADWFWRANFEIGPDFKGNSEQKKKIYACLADIFVGPGMLGLSNDLESPDGKLYLEAIMSSERDEGGYIDIKAENILKVLNSQETKAAVAAYLDYLDAKENIKPLIKS